MPEREGGAPNSPFPLFKEPAMKASPVAPAAVLVFLVVAFASVWTFFLRGLLPNGPVRHGLETTTQLSGPYSHENLTIYLVHGPDRFHGKNYLTLPEAIAQQQFVILETQNVNQLSMENLSSDSEVLILSGDILKGGQQDRIAQYDMLVPANSGKVPLPAFCVEHTAPRWMARLDGSNSKFAGTTGLASARTLNLANRLEGSQTGVWKGVSDSQVRLSISAGVPVQAAESTSSLALSLDAKPVREATEKYLANLADIPQGKSGVIGYVYAINGKIYGADVYGSTALFQKVWPRLIQASATEAFAELQKEKAIPPVTEALVQAYLADAERGKTSTQDVGHGVRQRMNNNERNVLFETAEKKGEVIRCNIVSH
jgi:hypothetical protein